MIKIVSSINHYIVENEVNKFLNEPGGIVKEVTWLQSSSSSGERLDRLSSSHETTITAIIDYTRRS